MVEGGALMARWLRQESASFEDMRARLRDVGIDSPPELKKKRDDWLVVVDAKDVETTAQGRQRVSPSPCRRCVRQVSPCFSWIPTPR